MSGKIRRGGKEGLILIHAFPLNSNVFSKNLKVIPERFTVVTPDLPGFGSSQAFSQPPSDLTGYVQTIEEVRKYFGLDRIILGGCSMGGYISFEYLRHYSENVIGLVVIDSRAGADSEDGRSNRLSVATLFENVAAKSVGEAVRKSGPARQFLEGLLHKLVSGKNLDRLREDILELIEPQNPVGIAHAMRAMAGRADTLELLRRFNKPSIVVVGEDDYLTPDTEAKLMADALEGSTYVVVRNAGHLSHYENPDEFNNAFGTWLNSLT